MVVTNDLSEVIPKPAFHSRDIFWCSLIAMTPKQATGPTSTFHPRPLQKGPTWLWVGQGPEGSDNCRPGCGWVRVQKGLVVVWKMGLPGPIQDGPDNGFGGDRKIFTHEDMSKIWELQEGKWSAVTPGNVVDPVELTNCKVAKLI